MGKHIEIEHRVGQTAENGGNAGHSHRVLLAKEVVNKLMLSDTVKMHRLMKPETPLESL